MTDSNADGRQPLNPQALSVGHVARILTASGREPVTVDMVRADIDGGLAIGTANTAGQHIPYPPSSSVARVSR